MVFSTESLVFFAFMIGIISAVSLPLGALTSFVWRPDQRVIAALMAFGAGSLLAALTIDLVAVSLDAGHFEILAAGCVIGGILFIALDNLVANYGGYRRKFSTTMHHRNAQNRSRFKATLSHLGRMEIFNELKDEDVDYLSQSVKSRFYPKGSSIFTVGDIANELYIIQEGVVELFAVGDESKKSELCKDDAFGKSALFTGTPHAMNAKAKVNCYVSVISKEALEGLLHASDAYREQVLAWLLSDEITEYLTQNHGIDKRKIELWREELKNSFKEEAILPDICDIDRREEEFAKIAGNIKRISWLEELDEEEIEALSGFLTYKTFKQGSTLFSQGEPAEYIYIIHEGEVELLSGKDKNSLHKQVSGDGIGMRAFLCGLRHTVGATAVSDVKVWALKKSDFESLIDIHGNFRLRVAYYLKDEALQNYLEKRYNLNQARILHWRNNAAKNIKNGRLPQSMIEMGIESTNQHGASLAIWLGILLDGIPESLVIGANMIHGSISVSLVAGLFLSNYPEALSSSRGMQEERLSKGKILLMWSSIMIFTGVGAAFGNVFMQSAEVHWFSFIEGLAAGAMLTMIAQTMLPEAYAKGGSVTGFATLMGFLITISLKGLEG